MANKGTVHLMLSGHRSLWSPATPEASQMCYYFNPRSSPGALAILFTTGLQQYLRAALFGSKFLQGPYLGCSSNSEIFMEFLSITFRCQAQSDGWNWMISFYELCKWNRGLQQTGLMKRLSLWTCFVTTFKYKCKYFFGKIKSIIIIKYYLF